MVDIMLLLTLLALAVTLIFIATFYTTRKLLVTSHLPNKGSIETFNIEQVQSWLDDLVEKCKEYNVRSIITINRGGILAGSYIAIKLDIPDSNILRCSVSKNSDKVEFITQQVACSYHGNVLLIDDVLRSGLSFMLAREYVVDKIIAECNFDISEKLIPMALVANGEAYSTFVPGGKKYTTYLTSRFDARLPWHDKEAEAYIASAAESRQKLLDVKEKLERKRLEGLNELKDSNKEEIASRLEQIGIKVST